MSFTVDDPDDGSMTVTSSYTSTNPNLIQSITITPETSTANGRTGTATITLTVTDAEGLTATDRTSVLTVPPVNDAPSFTQGANITVDEDAPAQSVPGWATAISMGPGETGQQHTFTVVNDNLGLFAQAPALATNGIFWRKSWRRVLACRSDSPWGA